MQCTAPICVVWLIMILCTSVSIVSYQTHTNNEAFALSPSFVRQEIVAAPDDWHLWKGSSGISHIKTHDGQSVQVEDAKNISECKNGNKFFSPGIESVSYISNGTLFNGTVWLNSNFEVPPLKDTLDIYPKLIEIKESNLPKASIAISPEKYAAVRFDELRAELYNPLNNLNNITFENQKTNMTTISGHHAFRVTYTAKNSQGLAFKNMTLWTTNGNKGYDITYSALASNYSKFMPLIQKAISSIQFEDIPDVDSKAVGQNDSQVSKLTNFHGLGIKLEFPTGWRRQTENIDSQGGAIIFRAPYEDEGLDMPAWHETTYTMAIAIDSVQHPAVTDYRVILNRSQSNDTNSAANHWTWTRQVYEVSANDKTRLLERENNYVKFHDKLNPYVLFYFNLNKINFPQQYKAAFYITDYFVKAHVFCRLVDITNWIIIPPPQYSISTGTNSSIVLRPGQEKNVELVVKGNTHLASEAVLTAYNNNSSTKDKNSNNNLNLTFIPSKISILPNSAGVSTLHVKASQNAIAEEHTLPIVANIYFPNTITNKGGETFSNSKRESLSQISNLTLTILPSYTVNELLSNFVSSWITPISGLWTFLAGVGAVIAPLVISLYRKKRRSSHEYNKEGPEK